MAELSSNVNLPTACLLNVISNGVTSSAANVAWIPNDGEPTRTAKQFEWFFHDDMSHRFISLIRMFRGN